MPGVGAAAPGDGPPRATPASSTRSVAWIAADRPFLGICLGLQLLFEGSDEDGARDARRPARAGRAGSRTPRRSPHIGWNQVERPRDHPLFDGIAHGADFYFVHSYAGRARGRRPTTSSSPRPSTAPRFVSAVARGTCSASSSIPERSGDDGLRLLANFVSLVRTGGLAAAGRGVLMLRRRVIPCLDVADGRVVKGTRFVDLVDEGDPPELAERYAREGADELVFLDITAAPERRGTLLDIVERTARRAFIPLTVGGGVRTVDEMRDVLRAGADKVSLNTAAVADPDLVTRARDGSGRQAVVVAIDARWSPNEAGAGTVSSRAGARRRRSMPSTGPQRAVELGAGELLVTSIDRDGTGLGFDTELLRAITDRVSRAGHRLGRRRGPGRFRGRGPRRGRRCRARGLDLPPPDPFDRVGQGGDGRVPVCRSGHDRGRRGVTVDPQYGDDGLVPAIVQDAADGRVLMLAWMDEEALSATVATGEVHFHSRSRDRCGGRARRAATSCVSSTSRTTATGTRSCVTVDPVGPTCHRGTRSCFDPDGAAATRETQGFAWLEALWATIADRAATRPEGSYTARLLAGGVDAAGRKVTEEATEVLMAAKDDAAGSTPRAPCGARRRVGRPPVPPARAARRARRAPLRGLRRTASPPPQVTKGRAERQSSVHRRWPGASVVRSPFSG